jgi:hypothetical protein
MGKDTKILDRQSQINTIFTVLKVSRARPMQYESTASAALHARRVGYRKGAQESGDRGRIYGQAREAKRASQSSPIAGRIFRVQTRMLSPALSLA